jgi:hypothetical protein
MSDLFLTRVFLLGFLAVAAAAGGNCCSWLRSKEEVDADREK